MRMITIVTMTEKAKNRPHNIRNHHENLFFCRNSEIEKGIKVSLVHRPTITNHQRKENSICPAIIYQKSEICPAIIYEKSENKIMRCNKDSPVQPSGNTPRDETKHEGPDNEPQQPRIVKCNFSHVDFTLWNFCG